MKKFDAIALGESLIDFTPKGKSEDGMKLFEQNPGGAVANVMAALSKFDKKTGFIGKVGDDMHGQFLIETMQQAGIDTSNAQMDPNVFTTLAFVDLKDDGQREFYFARKPGADTCLKPEEIDEDYIASSVILHVGSLSLTDEPVKSATLRALEIAKKHELICTYDPNYRAMLWENKEVAKTAMRSILEYVDIIKISDEETELLTGFKEPSEAAQVLLNQGISIVAITLGKDGALVATKDGMQHIDGFKADVIDTTGAGDSFFGGFINELIELGLKDRESLGKININDASKAARFGNAVASLNVEKRGAIPAMPSKEMVEKRLNSIE